MPPNSNRNKKIRKALRAFYGFQFASPCRVASRKRRSAKIVGVTLTIPHLSAALYKNLLKFYRAFKSV
ncbi:MAG: hypothetical protein DCC52_13970 [Chloroflexi bacterium]|nr:MAG: hypothetical protein DCC52_13970 [Chloroflexota bacterium]